MVEKESVFFTHKDIVTWLILGTTYNNYNSINIDSQFWLVLVFPTVKSSVFVESLSDIGYPGHDHFPVSQINNHYACNTTPYAKSAKTVDKNVKI